MNIGRKARHLCIVGRSGTGKTTCGIRYLLPSHHDRIVVADHEGEFAVRLGVPLNQSWEEFYDALERQRVTCLDITEVSPGDTAGAFDRMSETVLDLCKTVFEPKGMETLLVIDEVQKYTTAHTVPPNFLSALETGRKWNLDTLSLSQRPNGINTALREQFTEIFFFRMTERRSHEFGEYYGLTAEEQSGLDDGEFIYLNMRTGERRQDRLWPKGQKLA